MNSKVDQNIVFSFLSRGAYHVVYFMNTFYTCPIRGKSLWIGVKVDGPGNILGPSTLT